MGGNDASRLLGSTLLTPPDNATKINRKDFRNLDEHLKPGDRIAWHRPYMLIHEAIVLKVDAEESVIWVFERTKSSSSSSCSRRANISNSGSSDSSSSDSASSDGSSSTGSHRGGRSNRGKRSKNDSLDDSGAPYGPGIAKITKVNLPSQLGQLYRYNDTRDPESLTTILKQVLTNLDTSGYNIFAFNCQSSVKAVETDGKNTGSHQTRWLTITQAMEAVGISLSSEVLEKYYGGAEWIGIMSAGILHAFAFIIELIAALLKYKRGHMSRDDLRTVISRQLLMHVVGWFGNFLSSFRRGNVLLQFTGIVPFVLVFFFAIVADALFLYAGGDPDSWWRYLPMVLGSVTGLCLGFAATGAYLEFLVSMILGFAGKFVGHGLYHAGSWLLEWFKSERFDGRYVESVTQLRKGDHITTYERFWHPHCHAIFHEIDNGKMKIIRNTYRNGVIEDVVPFYPNWVYRYDYPATKVRNPEDVVRIALSKTEDKNEYSWVSYNCKTFAEQCKLAHVSSGSNIIDWEGHYNEIMKDSNISKEEKKKFKKNFPKFQKSLTSSQRRGHSDRNGKINQNMTPDNQPSTSRTDEQSPNKSRGKKRSAREMLRSRLIGMYSGGARNF